MSISLGATIDQAQAAFDSGDYRSVVDSCTHIIDQFPHYSAAQRLLGQAYLEQGQVGEAEAWFGRLLVHNPRDPSAYLGLGLIAEDRGVLDHALAYCQVAWELAPYDDAFRNPVNRVAEKRYGSDGRLRLTHAALAEIHAHAARLRRAIKEYQSALIALPDRIDLWMGLAEALWQLGEDEDAAEIAREFLSDHSDLIPALIILADIEQRQGNPEVATEHRSRLRQIDPDGALVATMLVRNRHADADFLLVKSDEQPNLSDKVEKVVSEQPRYAPAPDFNYMPENENQAAEMDIEDLQPISIEEFTDDLPGLPDIPDEPEVSSFVPEGIEEEEEEPDTVEVEPLTEHDASEVEEAPSDHESAAPEPEPALPVRDDTVPTPAINLLDMELDDTQQPFADDADDDADIEGLLDGLDGIEPMSLDDFGASDGVDEIENSGFFQDSEIDFDIKIEDPDAVQIGGGPPTVAPGVFGGGVAQSADLDDEFPELPEVDELDHEDDVQMDPADASTVVLDPSAMDEADNDETANPASVEAEAVEHDPVDEAAPAPEASDAELLPVQQGTGFTRLLGDIGSEGLAPFDPTRTATDPAPAAGDDEEHPFASLASGWDDIDDELALATPDGSDELLDIDELGLVPFELDDEDIDLVTSVEPVGFSPLATPAEPAEDADDQAVSPESDPDGVADDSEPQDREAFAFEEVEGTSSLEFRVLPWEQDNGGDGLDVQELLAEVSDTDDDELPSFDPELQETDESSHFAVTQELANRSLDPQFTQRMAEVEEAARQNLDRVQRDKEALFVAAESESLSATTPDNPDEHVSTPSADSLVNDPALFQRTRSAKEELIEQGTIRGDREFAAAAPTIDPAEVSEETPPAPPEPVPSAQGIPDSSPSHANSDLAALKKATEDNQDDDEAHWQYGEALREQGDIHAAFTEYRWLIRHAPGRHNAIIAALEQCVLRYQEEDLAHRLLADIYRRRGDSAQARIHASMAMATRRLNREVKM